MKYKKTCKHCGKEFESESRGTRYCSAECCEKAQSHNKRKAKRRREYDKNREANILVSTAYALAQRVAKMFSIPQDMERAKQYVMERLGQTEADLPKAEGRWELHHIDLNVLNNHPRNLIWLPVSLHAFYHSKTSRVNHIDILKDYETKPFEAKISLLEELLTDAREGKKR